MTQQWQITVLGGYPKKKRRALTDFGKPLVFESRAIARRWIRNHSALLVDPKVEPYPSTKS